MTVIMVCRFQVLYNYAPRNEDELELKEGDIVDVMERCDDGWFVGRSDVVFICSINIQKI
jgi:hypothetical protein